MHRRNRRPVARCILPAVLIAAAAGTLALQGCESRPDRLRMATPNLPIDREIAEDIVGLLGDSESLRVSLVPGDSTDEDAMRALDEGTADIAIVSDSAPFDPGVAAVMPLYPTVLHIAYRADRDASNPKTLLHGARVFADAEGSPSRRMFERVIERAGIDASDFEYVTDSISDADLIVLFTPVTAGKLDQFPGFRLLSLASPDDVGNGSLVDAATLLNPQLRPFIIPAGTYGSEATPAPVVTLAVDKSLVARHDLDLTSVYHLVSELLRLRPALASKHPGLFSKLSENFDTGRSPFVLHAGAQAFLQRDAPTLYERYSGVAEVVISILLAAISATIAGVRVFRVRRKNRIDAFYSTALEIRNSIDASSSAAERSAAIARVRELQNTAFEMLVSERLAADDSFRIFITLSDDVLRQLGAYAPDATAPGTLGGRA